MENKYANGKIYKIVDTGYNKCYIGSTIESLSKRMCKHRAAYHSYSKSGSGSYCTCYEIFNEFGINNCKIELVESCQCNSKEELNSREGFYIKNMECVNRVVPKRTKKEWAEETNYYNKYNSEHQDVIKAYRDNHKDKRDAYNKTYRETCRDKIRQSCASYYSRNKEQILNSKKEKVACVCGSVVCIGDMRKHQTTEKHKSLMNDSNSEKNTEV